MAQGPGCRTTRESGVNRANRADRPVRVLCGVVVMLGCGALLSGCRDPLFDPAGPRSQFSGYDALRGNDEPEYVQDPFGERRPNLRGRLLRSEVD